MNKRKLLAKVRNNPKDVRFSDLVLLVEAFGFRLDRIRGDHHWFEHPSLPRTALNFQEADHGKAKTYQVRQFLRLVDLHVLTLEDDDEQAE